MHVWFGLNWNLGMWNCCCAYCWMCTYFAWCWVKELESSNLSKMVFIVTPKPLFEPLSQEYQFGHFNRSLVSQFEVMKLLFFNMALSGADMSLSASLTVNVCKHFCSKLLSTTHLPLCDHFCEWSGIELWLCIARHQLPQV